jgi:hypothetical protein
MLAWAARGGSARQIVRPKVATPKTERGETRFSFMTISDEYAWLTPREQSITRRTTPITHHNKTSIVKKLGFYFDSPKI